MNTNGGGGIADGGCPNDRKENASFYIAVNLVDIFPLLISSECFNTI